jgi:hypothetical protein
MNEYDKNRKSDLLVLLNSIDIKNVSEDDLETVINLENEMSNNKNMLVELNENGIIDDLEYEIKIAKCFDVFLSKIVLNFGEAFCKKVYDYLPGGKLGFLDGFEKNRLAANAMEVSTISSNLMKMIDDNYDLTMLAGFKDLVNQISNRSNEMVKGASEHHQLISEMRIEISANIELINKTVIPAGTTALPLEKSSGSVWIEANNINLIKARLDAIINIIQKL